MKFIEHINRKGKKVTIKDPFYAIRHIGNMGLAPMSAKL